MKSSKELFYKLSLPSKKWAHYFDIYDRYLTPFIGKEANILEIGIDRGGSLELWHNFLENPNIFGVDANSDVKNIKFHFPVNLELGDQADLSFWEKYIATKPEFDIIIDDGGHYMHQQVHTLVALFPRLKDNGVYIIEDVHTSYVAGYNGGFRKQDTFIENCKNLVEMINFEFITNIDPPRELAQTFFNLCNISFYNSIIVLEKRPRPKIEPVEINF